MGSPPALTKWLLSSPVLRDAAPLCFGLRGSPGCLLPVHVHPPPCLTAQGSSSICYIDHIHRVPTILNLFPLCRKISHLETEGLSGTFGHCHGLQAVLLCHLSCHSIYTSGASDSFSHSPTSPHLRALAHPVEPPRGDLPPAPPLPPPKL